MVNTGTSLSLSLQASSLKSWLKLGANLMVLLRRTFCLSLWYLFGTYLQVMHTSSSSHTGLQRDLGAVSTSAWPTPLPWGQDGLQRSLLTSPIL